ncbi:MAG TPA: response regulator [Syntrophobacteraceae bacterium]|nr:response regulator [Syntrophobacteraceae bacterium]
MNYKTVNRIVLVMVDDDEDDCLLVEAALYEAEMKCDFYCVKDGQGVLDYLNRKGSYQDTDSSPRPDIILLDLNLPSMSGREVLLKLKSDHRFRSIPVIILTASSDNEDISYCYDTGANTYIIKEPSFAGLLAGFKVVKEYWLETATLPPKGDFVSRKKD